MSEDTRTTIPLPDNWLDTVKYDSYVLSLCDYSGVALQPWAEAGYYCFAIDIQNENHIEEIGDGCIHYINVDVREYKPPDTECRIAFAWPPCTHLAISGARWFKDKGLSKLAEGIEMVGACQDILTELDCPWMIENPVSTLSTYWREPDYKFDPYEYNGYTENDETYTKKTCLWVDNGFRLPPVDSGGVERDDCNSKMHDNVSDKNKRSQTPMGFSRAVFKEHELGGGSTYEVQTKLLDSVNYPA